MPQDSVVNNKRIVKNTAFMYFRMALTILIGLFSVRIVLKALGTEDYGIYNVVGGIVTMLAFLNNAMSSSTQRFLSFELGKDNKLRLNAIFCTSMTLYIWFCFLILIMSETIGLWFVNYKLIIPDNRMSAANWIYQFSIFSFMFSVLSAPYLAAIISREKMQVYAYASVASAFLKLGMIYVLLFLTGDKLIVYGLFLLLIGFAEFLFYYVYCKIHFEETRYRYFFDIVLLKEIGSFTGWSIWGALSNIFKSQGVNILLNMFFGPIINAARAVAYQVEGAINTLVQNFFVAVKPQLIKSHAIGREDEVFNLLFLSTRLGFYLMFLVSLFFIAEAPIILQTWLDTVPDNSIVFTRLVLISQLFIVLANPLMTSIHATGKVAKYQFWSGCIFVSVLPVSYLCLSISENAIHPFVVLIIAGILYWALTIERCYKLIRLPLREYSKVIFRLILVSMIVSLGTCILCSMCDESWLRLFFQLFYIVIFGVMSIYFIDCSKKERQLLKSILYKRVRLKL